MAKEKQKKEKDISTQLPKRAGDLLAATLRKTVNPETGVVDSKKFEDLFRGMHFEGIKFMPRDAVPANRRFSARSVRDLPAVRGFEEVLKVVRENKDHITPYEVAAELELDSPEAREIAGPRKMFATSLRRVLRELLREYQLTDKLQITSSDKGTRFFFVGKS